MADISSVGFTADLLQARYQIAMNRSDQPEPINSEPSRVQQLREMLERAGAEPQPQLEQGVGERLDILV
ncbi:hypothetical protein GCM10007276_29990 [Agaricicola taiwanensis]|uniref:Uncharacterized protein n=1 Tax=Agaricicola taiwanensis TaxID=591372 RepID=A0A8J2YKZ2_9RHOB|nr:hypothetical protein [Agaricicola taiwanensis]GGE50991.1 hypothetical protein GCM10007276_29990 [Agaricicola taiwanensis]